MFLSSVFTLCCLFFSCLYSKGSVYGLWMLPILLERAPRSTYGTQNTGPHFWLLCLLTQLLSCCSDPIPGVVNITKHTHTHTEEHEDTHNMFVFSLYVSAAHIQLDIEFGGLGAFFSFGFCQNYYCSFRGCLTGRSKMHAFLPSAITKTGLLG